MAGVIHVLFPALKKSELVRTIHFSDAQKRLPEISESLEYPMVPKAGLEPARRVTTLDFESSASANSATSAFVSARYRAINR